MKLGIETLEYISTSKCKDWSFARRNQKMDLTPFITGEWNKLDFTPLMLSFEEEWLEEQPGLYSQITITGNIRFGTRKETTEAILSSLLPGKNLFKIKLVSGETRVTGSVCYIPKFLYKNIEDGISSSEFIITISCKSTHGSIVDTGV